MNIAIGYLDSNIGGVNKHIISVVNILKNSFETIVLLSTGKLATPYMDVLDKLDNVQIEIIPNSLHFLDNYNTIKKILIKYDIEIFYNNLSTNIPCFGLIAAKNLKISRRITHSHSSGLDIKNPFKRMIYYFFNLFFRPFVVLNTTDFLACSSKASNWLFGRRSYIFVPNAVERKKFENVAFDASLKESLDIKKDKTVIGFIGRFSYQKNIDFICELIKVMDKERFHFLLIGDGPETYRITNLIQSLGYDNISLLCSKNNIEVYYKLMDIFILPSRFEGLPIVGIEAQMSSLKCVFSDKITEETAISNACFFLPIKPIHRSVKIWKETIDKIQTDNISIEINNSKFDMEYFSSLIRNVILKTEVING